jgi:hypothetical protein
MSPFCQNCIRYEVFAAVAMNNVVFWDIETLFVPHRKHYFSVTEASPLMLCKIWGFHDGAKEESRAALVRTDVSEENIASIMKVTRIGELRKTLSVFLRSVLQLLLTVKIVPNSPILVSLMVEAIWSSKTSVLIRAARPRRRYFSTFIWFL